MSSTALTSFTQGALELIERVVLHGDLARLSPAEKVDYYKTVCQSVGLNPLTKPFDYIRLNGKEVLYATKSAAEQLRNIHRISIAVTSRDLIGEMYVVTARASDPSGRFDESTGAICVAGLKGESLANAYMKAETKAKRRVTLSICGLSVLDESELDGVPVEIIQQEPEQKTLEPSTKRLANKLKEKKQIEQSADNTVVAAIKNAKSLDELEEIVDKAKSLDGKEKEDARSAWKAKLEELTVGKEGYNDEEQV